MEADPGRIVFDQHFHQRARRRNIDWNGVKEEVKQYNFVDVRENMRSDPRFEHSYKVTVEVEGRRYELPIYFNVPGPRILVKSIWPA